MAALRQQPPYTLLQPLDGVLVGDHSPVGVHPGTDRCLLASAAIRLSSIARPIAADRPLAQTPLHHRLEQMPQDVALQEPAMTIALEGGVVWHPAVKS